MAPPMTGKPELQLLLYKRRNDQFAMAACRGRNKGCEKLIRESERKKLKKPCEDCVLADNPNETVGELFDRTRRGDA